MIDDSFNIFVRSKISMMKYLIVRFTLLKEKKEKRYSRD